MLVLVQGLGIQGGDGLLVKESTQLEPSNAAGSVLSAPILFNMNCSRCVLSVIIHTQPFISGMCIQLSGMAFASLCKVVVYACMWPPCMFAWFQSMTLYAGLMAYYSKRLVT